MNLASGRVGLKLARPIPRRERHPARSSLLPYSSILLASFLAICSAYLHSPHNAAHQTARLRHARRSVYHGHRTRSVLFSLPGCNPQLNTSSGFYAKSSINYARENASNERGKSYERVLSERRALGMDGDLLEDRMRRKAEKAEKEAASVGVATAEKMGASAASKGPT